MDPRLVELLETVWSGGLSEAQAISLARERELDPAPLLEVLRAGSAAVPTTLPFPQREQGLPAPDEDGQVRIGNYVLIERIGRGGMGVVYRARQAGLEREVALKLMISGRDASSEAIERFLLEARSAASLRHENLVEIYEVGQDGEVYYFSMEYVRGRSLAAILEEGALPPHRAARLLRDAARGVAAAHASNILHRDLKPSNMLVGEGDRILVADFGLAKAIDQDTSLTRSGVLMGTPLYMPYEQFDPNGKVGPASDVYGLGATLYQALAGRPPFDPHLQPIQLLAQKDLQGAPRLSRVKPGVPRDLEVVVEVAMDRDPARRYPDAGTFAEDLDRYLKHEPIIARPPGPLRRAALWARRHPALAASVGFLALVALAGASWEARRLVESASAGSSVAEGDLLLDRGDHLGAIAWYGSALRRVPDHDDARRRRELAILIATQRAKEDLRSGRSELAESSFRYLREGVADPSPAESRQIQDLGRELGEFRAGDEEFTKDLEAARDAKAGELVAALGRLEERLARVDAAKLSPEFRTERVGAIAAAAGNLLRVALLENDEPILERLSRLLTRAGAGSAFPWTGEVRIEAVSRSWAGGAEEPLSVEVYAHRLKDGRWSGDQEPEVEAGLARPPFPGTFDLEPGLHLVTVRAPGRLPARFVLAAVREARVEVRLGLYPELELPIPIRHVPRLEVRYADLLETPADAGTPRARLLARYARGYSSASLEDPPDLAHVPDFFAAETELTNAAFLRLFPADPRWGYVPVGWDAAAWRHPPGEEDLPLRGLNMHEAKKIAAGATRRFLPSDLRGRWKFALPRTDDEIDTRERLGAGPHNPFFDENRVIEGVLRQLLGAAWDAEDFPLAAFGNQGTGQVAPAGRTPGDVSVHGLRDLEGNVAEWTSNDLKSQRFRTTGGAYRFHPDQDGDLAKLLPGERREHMGLRLLLVPDDGPPAGSEGVLDDPAVASRRALEIYRSTGDPLEAQILLEESLSAHPDHVPSRLNAALLCLAQQKWTWAGEHAQAALRLAEGDEALLARFVRVVALLQLDRVKEEPVDLASVLPDLDLMVEARPRSHLVRLGRAYVRILVGDFSSAARDLDVVLPQLLRLTRFERHFGLSEIEDLHLSDDPQIAFDEFLGRRFLAMADFPSLGEEVLVPDLEFARQAYPTGHSFKAAGKSSERFVKIIFKALKKDELERMFEAVRREGEERPAAIARVAGELAHLQALIGEKDGARAAIQLALILSASDPVARRLQGELGIYWGEFEAAESAVAPLLEPAPGDREALVLAAWARLERARTKEEALRVALLESARGYLERSRPAAASDEAIVRALLELEAGELDAARAALDRAGSPESEDGAWWIVRGEIARRAGDVAGAKEAWTQAAGRDKAYAPLASSLAGSLGE